MINAINKQRLPANKYTAAQSVIQKEYVWILNSILITLMRFPI